MQGVEISTIGACSTALGAIICIVLLVLWVKDGRPAQSAWYAAPFAMAVLAGVLLTFPDLISETRGLAVGWFALTLVYAFAWQTARVAAGLRPRPLAALLPCLAVLAWSITIAADGAYPDLRMAPRVMLFALFDGLAAREFARMAKPRLPSAVALRWLFVAYCSFELLRLPFAFFLPAPFGPEEPALWTIALFNFAIALHGVLFALLTGSLAREQQAARNMKLAATDPLTGVGNRRALELRKDAIEARGPRMAVVGVAMLDIDHFKKINDTYGHAFGDIVIANTAGLAQDVFGNGNIFRVGGEEFIAIIEADSAHEVVRQVETMRARMAAFVHAQEEVSIQCTVSIGFTLLDTLRPHEDAFRAADKALYTAKRMGRDRAIQATPKPGPNDGPAAKLELRFEEGEQHRFAAPAASYGNLALRSND